MHELPTAGPEKRESVPDDARKFIIEASDLPLDDQDRIVTYLLITDWIKMGEDDEEKIVFKQHLDGSVELLHIEKVSKDGKRTAVKRKISPEEYETKLKLSQVRVEKQRHELKMMQSGMTFDGKYDVFNGPRGLQMLEVDGEARDDFNAELFAENSMTEVSGDRSYEGYRIADKI